MFGKSRSVGQIEPPSSGFITQDTKRLARAYQKFNRGEIGFGEYKRETLAAIGYTDFGDLFILFRAAVSPITDWFRTRILGKNLFPGAPS